MGAFAYSPILRHELEHFYQVERIGWIRFYSSYFFEFVRNFIKYRNWEVAYLTISYEAAARQSERQRLTKEEIGYF